MKDHLVNLERLNIEKWPKNTRVSLGSQIVSLEEVVCVSEVKELDNHNVLLRWVRLGEIVQKLGH